MTDALDGPPLSAGQVIGLVLAPGLLFVLGEMALGAAGAIWPMELAQDMNGDYQIPNWWEFRFALIVLSFLGVGLLVLTLATTPTGRRYRRWGATLVVVGSLVAGTFMVATAGSRTCGRDGYRSETYCISTTQAMGRDLAVWGTPALVGTLLLVGGRRSSRTAVPTPELGAAP